MMTPIIHGLSNDEYHHGEEERKYLSSSQLKLYSVSPRYAKFCMDNPFEEPTEAMRFGSLFHDLMNQLAISKCVWDKATEAWRQGIAVFTPPVNPKTGKPYGSASQKFTESYAEFSGENHGKLVMDEASCILAKRMAAVMLNECGETSRILRRILRIGFPETSMFYTDPAGIKLKCRPDLFVPKGAYAGIYDYKTTADAALNEETINRAILRYQYHLSACHYQHVVHALTNRWYDFFLILVSKVEPFDCLIVNLSDYAYRWDKDWEIATPGPGVIEFQKLLDLHTECTLTGKYPGAEIILSDTDDKILNIQPPAYYTNKFTA